MVDYNHDPSPTHPFADQHLFGRSPIQRNLVTYCKGGKGHPIARCNYGNVEMFEPSQFLVCCCYLLTICARLGSKKIFLEAFAGETKYVVLQQCEISA